MRSILFRLSGNPVLSINLLLLLALAIMLLYALLSALWPVASLSCQFKIWYGFECPSCGLTRAFRSLLHGQFQQALQYHSGCLWVAGFFILQLLMRSSAGLLSLWAGSYTLRYIVLSDVILSLGLLVLFFGEAYRLF